MSARNEREHSTASVAAFWDAVYLNSTYSRKPLVAPIEAAINHFGDVRGATLIEIGCGPGAATLHFASLGANVIAVDVSTKAIESLSEFCNREGITNVRPVCSNALDVEVTGQVDFVYGSMILHHIEPFDQFASQLRRMLKPGGRAFFYENSAASRLLVWFRQNVVGRLWVPKYGDKDEFPLTPQEIHELRKHFNVQLVYPELTFFSLIGHYLLRGYLVGSLKAIDDFCFSRGWLLRYSYRQYVLLNGRDPV